jgi:pimeloyl-ACP methyl ester carboxylesterase
MYKPRRAAHRETIRVRNLGFCTYRWAGGDPHPIVLLHGWGDAAETWQIVVDHLPESRSCFAFDLRGFGRSERPEDGYWFPDYLADLEAMLDVLSPEAPVDLVGHSMGGNIATIYAGVRPNRVRRLVNLEGVGLARTRPEQAPERYAQWLDELKDPPEFATYDDYDQFMKVLRRRNPRTPPERLEFVARCWARPGADNRIELWADPRHKRVNPTLYQRDQAEACWRAVLAPVLFVMGGASDLVERMRDEVNEPRLKEIFRNVTVRTIDDAGHMLHHERPEEVARLIDAFLDDREP